MKKSIAEDPDTVYDGNNKKVAYYEDIDARPFLVHDEILYIGAPTDTHGDIHDKIGDHNEIGPNTQYDGRIWTDKKIISFWRNPKTRNELDWVINEIEKKLGIKIHNKGYVVDDNYRDQLIPLDDYKINKSGGDIKRYDHKKSPLLKKQKVVPYNKGREAPMSFAMQRGIAEIIDDEIVRIEYDGQSDRDMLKTNDSGRLFEDDDYRGWHRPRDKDEGSSLDDLSTVYPDDIYGRDALRLYGMGHEFHTADKEALSIIRKARNRPELKVKIFRAVPSDEKNMEIRGGDWVTITPTYAKLHGESRLDGDYKIIGTTVRAADLNTHGDSIHEWGWNP
jgi:hypothetical protein